jgi:hypothetical protein
MTYMEPILRPEGPPMSDEQAILLRRLCDEADRPDAYDPDMVNWRASRLIEALIDDLRLSVLPPHTD